IHDLAARFGQGTNEMAVRSALTTLDRHGVIERYDIPGRRVRGTRVLRRDLNPPLCARKKDGTGRNSRQWSTMPIVENAVRKSSLGILATRISRTVALVIGAGRSVSKMFGRPMKMSS